MDKAVTRLEAADIEMVLKMLPHRYPFLMVDRVINIQGDESGIGIKNVTINEPQFQGHFPGNPVFPGVLMIEGMAQTAGVLCIAATGRAAEISLLSYHRQGKIPQACAAGRHHRVPYETDRTAQIHVVVPRRGKGGRPDRRGSRSRRYAFRRMSARMIDPSARDRGRGRNRKQRNDRPLLHDWRDMFVLATAAV